MQGLTRCFSVVVPPRLVEQPLCKSADDYQKIAFITVPDDDHKVVFNIALTNKTMQLEDLEKLAGGSSILGPLDMKGELAWVLAHCDDFTRLERTALQTEIKKIKIHSPAGAVSSTIAFAFAHMVQEDSNSRFLIDLELGKENLEISDKA
jgi:hypothetical protein